MQKKILRWIKLIITILSLISYLGVRYIYKNMELELIYDSWYNFILIVFIIFAANLLYDSIKNLSFRVCLVSISVIICIFLFFSAVWNTGRYVELQSPKGSHQIIVKNQHIGFEGAMTTIYKIKNKFFRQYITTLYAEKSGGVVGDNEILIWLSENILKIEYIDFKREKDEYIIDFELNKMIYSTGPEHS